MATVSNHYVEVALRCAERGGLDRASLLSSIGVEPAQLQQLHGRVHQDQMARLVQLIWELQGDEFMSCTQYPCKPGSFAFMSRHALHYETLGAILRQGIQFYNLITDDIQMQLVPRGAESGIEIRFLRPELDLDGFFRDFWLVIWHRFASWVVGQKIVLRQVWFDYRRPAHSRELKLMFPCRHRFNRPVLKLCFASEYLELPCVRTQHELSDFLRHSPADLMTIPGEEKSFQARIRSQLLHAVDEALVCPAFEQLAQNFHVSAQTLRRRLKEEGTSYPQIKDELRRDLAIEKLVVQGLRVVEVARILGFSEPQSFSRAFKSWTGESPSDYQRRHSCGQSAIS
jgi:AraC-like DNA-binding protein